MNQYNYLPWDYKDGKLLYYTNGTENRCEMLTNKCIEYQRDYIPTTYILTKDYYFFNDIVGERICKYSHVGIIVVENYSTYPMAANTALIHSSIPF